MSIVLVYRNPKAGFSIYRCFAEFKNYIDVKELFLPEYRISIKNMIKNIRYIQKNTNKDDIIHITGDVHYVLLGLIHRKTVLTIHDTVLLDNYKRKDIKWILYYLFWFYFPCKIAKKVVCISEETKRRLQKYMNCKPYIIPDPVSSSFKKIKKVFNYNCPVILHIGTGWNKNINNVIKSLSGMKVKLVIIGNISEDTKELLLESKIDYEIKYGLTDTSIIQEYQNSDIISFPTVYEGFGLPILEGQTVGRVVVTSDIEPHKSVAGENGAIFVNPDDYLLIREGFIKAIDDEELRNRIIEYGYNNTRLYSFERVSMDYMKIYDFTNKLEMK